MLAGCATQKVGDNPRGGAAITEQKQITPSSDGGARSADPANLVESKIGAVFGGELHYTADSIHATKEVVTWRDLNNSSTLPVPKMTDATPDRKAWDTLWETVSQLQPAAWHQKYSTKDLEVHTNGTFLL